MGAPSESPCVAPPNPYALPLADYGLLELTDLRQRIEEELSFRQQCLEGGGLVVVRM